MLDHPPTRRDTQAWIAQVWISFVLAVILMVIGIARLPGEGLDRTLMATVVLFCLSAAFTLAKTLRDNRDHQADSQAWIVKVWAAFGVSHVAALWSLVRIDITMCERTYLVTCWFFLMSSTFTLSKTVRDNHEAARYQAALGAAAARAEPGVDAAA